MKRLYVIAVYGTVEYKFYRWQYIDNFHYIKKLNYENIISANVKSQNARKAINELDKNQLKDFILLCKSKNWKIYFNE